ncbi:hypothetical protein K402DRAFT_332291 [Aulographum hederae CBS 113979]|uniref:C2H2-type domain-containing protein n=1 Tax=Aulographum hederae CBS 113979 TaxID=1176131 RepID=A0A6G1H0M6_9PEZI|nr:hypothetical protein K402DRAFT_332291 [Aulographum hederae CBS 113979]
MDSQQQRGRSLSATRQNPSNRHTPSPSPNQGFRAPVTGLGLDNTLSDGNEYINGFNNNQLGGVSQGQFDLGANFNTSQPQQQAFTQQSNLSHGFLPTQTLQGGNQFNQQGNNSFPQDLLDPNNIPQGSDFDPQFYPSSDPSQDSIDPSFLLDPALQDPSFNNSQDLLNQMATTSAHHSPTPPHLLQPEMHRHSSNSPHHSPSMNQGGFPSPGQHSRNTSLDPSSAAFPAGNEWGGMGAFRNHRRTPSDAHSDVSSSAHPSPYLGHDDNFEHSSPYLNAQQDPAMFQDVMGIQQFSISDNHNPYISPGHSPAHSPRVMPQQHLPAFTAADNFGLSSASASHMNQFNAPGGMEMFPPQPQEMFPVLNQGNGSFEYGGPGEAMSPPEINIQLAPPSRQASFEPPKPEGQEHDALSPPDRSQSRNRMRAKSDPFAGRVSRASTPGGIGKNSLSPHAAARAASASRSPSPSGKGNRRSSTSSVPHRDYILDLADPSRPTSGASGDSSIGGNKRTQKHPATFQCSLCPKRFTRAYNLRSHLRTHTDERPFVCSVCGKAFARQHDRKRHEGLHSGEKKFVCRGVLKDSGSWGCGRRFARADALGRHFRSEAGRVCIKPLLEEEALEKGWHADNAQPNVMGQTSQPGMQMPQPGFENFPPQNAGMDPSFQGMGAQAYRLPAALYTQYPALAGIQWDQLPTGAPDEMEGDISGRSSFDATSDMGENFDDDDGDYGRQAMGWASDFEGR